MPHEQDFDQELYDALGLAHRGFAPHSHDLVQRAALRGRQLRRDQAVPTGARRRAADRHGGVRPEPVRSRSWDQRISRAVQSTSAAPTTPAVVDIATAMPVERRAVAGAVQGEAPGRSAARWSRSGRIRSRTVLRACPPRRWSPPTPSGRAATGTVAITITRTSPAANRVADTAVRRSTAAI